MSESSFFIFDGCDIVDGVHGMPRGVCLLDSWESSEKFVLISSSVLSLLSPSDSKSLSEFPSVGSPSKHVQIIACICRVVVDKGRFASGSVVRPIVDPFFRIPLDSPLLEPMDRTARSQKHGFAIISPLKCTANMRTVPVASCLNVMCKSSGVKCQQRMMKRILEHRLRSVLSGVPIVNGMWWVLPPIADRTDRVSTAAAEVQRNQWEITVRMKDGSDSVPSVHKVVQFQKETSFKFQFSLRSNRWKVPFDDRLRVGAIEWDVISNREFSRRWTWMDHAFFGPVIEMDSEILERDADAKEKRRSGLFLRHIVTGPHGYGKTHFAVNYARCRKWDMMALHCADMRNAADWDVKVSKMMEMSLEGGSGCVVLFDDIDFVASERKIIGQIEAWIDRWNSGGSCIPSGKTIALFATCNDIFTLPASILSAGRLDKTISLRALSAIERGQLLLSLANQYTCSHSEDVPLDDIVDDADLRSLSRTAEQMGGCSGMDLVRWFQKVLYCEVAMESEDDRMKKGCVLDEEVEEKMDSGEERRIVGYDGVKKVLRREIEWPLEHQKARIRIGLDGGGGGSSFQQRGGILLYGPPGCGKTSIVRSFAVRRRVGFFTLSSADVYSPFVGESEATIRQVFSTASTAAPSVIFIDEIDAIVGKRDGDTSSDVSTRILASLLTEMDGINVQGGVVVVAASNRPIAIDAALLRPGRFDHVVYVGPPPFQTRMSISKESLKGILIEHDQLEFASEWVAQNTEGWSGAEIRNLCAASVLQSLRNHIRQMQENAGGKDGITIFHRAEECILKEEWKKMKPVLTREMQLSYDTFTRKYGWAADG